MDAPTASARESEEERPSPPAILVVADSSQGMRAALPFALRVARAEDGAIRLLYVDTAAEEMGVPANEPEWLDEVLQNIEDVPARSDALGALSLPEAVENVARHASTRLAVVATAGEAVLTPPFRNFIAAPPCPALVLANAGEDFAPRRVLIATNTSAPISPEATTRSYDLANTGEDTNVTFLRLEPPETPESSFGTIESGIAERIAGHEPPFTYDVAVRHARSSEAGILDQLEAGRYDLVIVDAPRAGIVARLAERIVPARLVTGETPVMLYTTPASAGARVFMRAWNVVYRLIPSLSEEDKVATYTQLRRNSRGDVDFYVVLSLSVLIASLGLLLDSTAVVIGAMIIAPLMQPMVGVGLGVSLGNTRLTSIATRTTLNGILVSVMVAFLVGLLAPTSGITSELDARGQPTLLDLSIALASGAAGAYAICRKDVTSSIAGVAIAVALVPPLGTFGIALAMGEWPLAAGAALLFFTNQAAIGAASTVMFLWMGFKPEASRLGRRTAFVRGTAVLATLVVVIAFSITLWVRFGDARFDQQVRGAAEQAVQGIDPEAEVRGMRVDRQGNVVDVFLDVESPAPGEIRAGTAIIQSDISLALDRPVALTISASEPEAGGE